MLYQKTAIYNNNTKSTLFYLKNVLMLYIDLLMKFTSAIAAVPERRSGNR